MASQCISNKCVHNHTPYHVYDLKGHGSWFSDHQARISMRDGLRDQVCIFYMECNAHKHVKAQSLSLNQGTRHACSMQPKHVN